MGRTLPAATVSLCPFPVSDPKGVQSHWLFLAGYSTAPPWLLSAASRCSPTLPGAASRGQFPFSAEAMAPRGEEVWFCGRWKARSSHSHNFHYQGFQGGVLVQWKQRPLSNGERTKLGDSCENRCLTQNKNGKGQKQSGEGIQWSHSKHFVHSHTIPCLLQMARGGFQCT